MNVRKPRKYVALTREEFRFFERGAEFSDPAFPLLIEWLHARGELQKAEKRHRDYYEPYATSHDKLDASPDIFVEVESAAQSLANMVRALRAGAYRPPDAGLRHPRQK
jgi:hypothetical protein